MLFNNFTKKIGVIGLFMGMAASPLVFADNATALIQARFDAGASIQGGTREGSRQYRIEAENSQIVESEGSHYRTVFEAGSPELGGTKERMHRDRVEVDGDKMMSQQVAKPEHNDPDVGILAHGTRG
ncbi:hypothetical protein [Halovibrio sp. HP20-50]|uniref:hypothetical protein n=1 Tax=Halovibrio sp. HP20-59 TaxID=3080275 RepID=UPI00294AB314|nr:hypothetical protein [Halovibrio sp. HP20-59]MEA2117060.1 hypothetical protein [Halovibrio sp. HP20-59]